jgi:hypothetical protein
VPEFIDQFLRKQVQNARFQSLKTSETGPLYSDTGFGFKEFKECSGSIGKSLPFKASQKYA